MNLVIGIGSLLLLFGGIGFMQWLDLYLKKRAWRKAKRNGCICHVYHHKAFLEETWQEDHNPNCPIHGRKNDS